MHKITLVALFAIVAGFAAQTAQSATITNRAFAGHSGAARCGGEPSEAVGPTSGPANATYTTGSTGCGAQSRAFADGGLVSAYSEADSFANNQISSETFGTASANASFSASGLFFTPASGYTNQQLLTLYGNRIPVTLFVSFSAQTGAQTGESGAAYTASAGSAIDANVVFSNEGSVRWREVIGSGAVSDTGELSDRDSFSDTIGLSGTVNWRRASSVSMSLSTIASASHPSAFDHFSSAFADASNTLSFNTEGPAFLLPEGFTINAPELNIFDNMWIDPRITNEVAPVPLPAAGYLMLIGLLGMRVLRR